MIVIHPKDKTTSFLRQIYLGKENVKVIDETWNNRQIREAIGTAPKEEVIMMLGHGYNRGLFAPWGDNQFGRTIVDDRLVYLLREHPCVGIWCYANEFAENYELKGLFTGMVVSDANEAMDNCLDFEGEDIELLNQQYASDMEYCLRNYPLDRVPKIMREVQDYSSPIKDFNYNSLYYYK
jgi:hypothetical protein